MRERSKGIYVHRASSCWVSGRPTRLDDDDDELRQSYQFNIVGLPAPFGLPPGIVIPILTSFMAALNTTRPPAA